MEPSFCAWCGAPRAEGVKCPRCGAIYAKAEALRSAPSGSVLGMPEASRAEVSDWTAVPGALEWKVRAVAVPAALLIALLFHSSPLGRFLQRAFLSMMLHELGHAIASWCCGIFAVPTLWKTIPLAPRGFAATLLMLGGASWLVVAGLRHGRRGLVALGGLLLMLAIAGRALSADAADALIVFAGDGGAMLLGAALVISFFAPEDSQRVAGGLRWGFLAIGAAALVDVFSVWWAARTDVDAIPFGETEGVGLSDPSRLSEVHGWSAHRMVDSYVALGALCLTAIAVAYVWGVWSARPRRASQGV